MDKQFIYTTLQKINFKMFGAISRTEQNRLKSKFQNLFCIRDAAIFPIPSKPTLSLLHSDKEYRYLSKNPY